MEKVPRLSAKDQTYNPTIYISHKSIALSIKFICCLHEIIILWMKIKYNRFFKISTVQYILSDIYTETEELYTDYYVQTLLPSKEAIPHIQAYLLMKQPSVYNMHLDMKFFYS